MLKNKKIFLIIVLFILLLSITNSSFASVGTSVININGFNYIFSEDNLFSWIYVYSKSDDNVYRLVHWGTPCADCGTIEYYFYEDEENAYFEGRCSHGTVGDRYSIWVYDKTVTDHSSWINNGVVQNMDRLTFSKSDYNFVYCYGNIYSDSEYSIPLNTEGNSFFLKAPLTVAKTLIVERVEMEVVLQEIVKILPLIIVVVVCFLGLRKALQILSTLLRRCLII